MSADTEKRLNGLRRRRFDFDEHRLKENLLRLDAMKNQLDKINQLLHEYVSQVHPVRNPRAWDAISNGVKEDKVKRQDKSHLLN